MKILVADDDPITLHLLKHLLGIWGYEVTCVQDGDAAWDLLEKDPSLTLAILDWMMPGRNGVDIVKRLRSTTSRPYTYVLLLTAKTGKSEVLEALHAGCDDYLSKPFDAQELQARLLVGKRIIDLQTKLTNALRTTEYQATHDALTGLLNRGAILEVLRHEANRARRSHTSVAVALLDIDHFKAVNDSHGHLAGDEVLRIFAQRIRVAIRSYDVVGRFGGEEFLILLPGNGSGEALTVCERICRAISEKPFLVSDVSLRVTASIGVATCNSATDINELLQAADTAMYKAKANGRNRVEVASLSELLRTETCLSADRSTECAS